MSALLSFFAAGPARIQGLLIGALAAGVLCLALLSAALWYRGEALQAQGERDLARAQSKVLASAVDSCTVGVDQGKRAADAAVAVSGELLKAAQRLKVPAKHTVERVEKILERPTPDGAGCDKAWDAVEQERKARAP